jgi:uncharacterized protein involved in type VI secretion and phage assembly
MSQVNGVVVGLVTNVNDPEKLGRIRVAFPWLDASYESEWIRIATMMAGSGRGSFFMPEVNDEVLLAFEHGDSRFPYVIGFLWNGKDKPPTEHVRDRMLKSKNGHTIRFLDSTPVKGDQGGIIIEDAHRNRITMTNAQITIRSTGALVLEGASVVVRVNGVFRVVAPNGNAI